MIRFRRVPRFGWILWHTYPYGFFTRILLRIWWCCKGTSYGVGKPEYIGRFPKK